MIYYKDRAVFVHIPRTSGISLSYAVLNQRSPHEAGLNVVLGELSPFRRHVTANDLQNILADWDEIQKITFVRNPWRICESHYRHFCERHYQHSVNGQWTTSKFHKFAAQVSEMPFEEFVPWHFKYLKKGFYDHWAQDWKTNQALGVRAFRFENLDEVWPEVCEIMRLPRDIPRPKENGAPRAKLEWSDEAIAFIQERCELDFELFDYPRCP